MSVPDEVMKLKDGKIIVNKLKSMVAVQFVQETANDAGTYVVYQGQVYYLPDGHTANTTWANTTKVGPTNIGDELTGVKNAIQGMSIEEKLLRDELPGTTTTVTMDNNGNPTSIVHSENGNTVRTDSFVWSENSVVETRTASSKYITITTNLQTLAQAISDIGEVE